MKYYLYLDDHFEIQMSVKEPESRCICFVENGENVEGFQEILNDCVGITLKLIEERRIEIEDQQRQDADNLINTYVNKKKRRDIN